MSLSTLCTSSDQARTCTLLKNLLTDSNLRRLKLHEVTQDNEASRYLIHGTAGKDSASKDCGGGVETATMNSSGVISQTCDVPASDVHHSYTSESNGEQHFKVRYNGPIKPAELTRMRFVADRQGRSLPRGLMVKNHPMNRADTHTNTPAHNPTPTRPHTAVPRLRYGGSPRFAQRLNRGKRQEQQFQKRLALWKRYGARNRRGVASESKRMALSGVFDDDKHSSGGGTANSEESVSQTGFVDDSPLHSYFFDKSLWDSALRNAHDTRARRLQNDLRKRMSTKYGRVVGDARNDRPTGNAGSIKDMMRGDGMKKRSIANVGKKSESKKVGTSRKQTHSTTTAKMSDARPTAKKPHNHTIDAKKPHNDTVDAAAGRNTSGGGGAASVCSPVNHRSHKKVALPQRNVSQDTEFVVSRWVQNRQRSVVRQRVVLKYARGRLQSHAMKRQSPAHHTPHNHTAPSDDDASANAESKSCPETNTKLPVLSHSTRSVQNMPVDALIATSGNPSKPFSEQSVGDVVYTKPRLPIDHMLNPLIALSSTGRVSKHLFEEPAFHAIEYVTVPLRCVGHTSATGGSNNTSRTGTSGPGRAGNDNEDEASLRNVSAKHVAEGGVHSDSDVRIPEQQQQQESDGDSASPQPQRRLESESQGKFCNGTTGEGKAQAGLEVCNGTDVSIDANCDSVPSAGENANCIDDKAPPGVNVHDDASASVHGSDTTQLQSLSPRHNQHAAPPSARKLLPPRTRTPLYRSESGREELLKVMPPFSLVDPYNRIARNRFRKSERKAEYGKLERMRFYTQLRYALASEDEGLDTGGSAEGRVDGGVEHVHSVDTKEVGQHESDGNIGSAQKSDLSDLSVPPTPVHGKKGMVHLDKSRDLLSQLTRECLQQLQDCHVDVGGNKDALCKEFAAFRVSNPGTPKSSRDGTPCSHATSTHSHRFSHARAMPASSAHTAHTTAMHSGPFPPSTAHTASSVASMLHQLAHSGSENSLGSAHYDDAYLYGMTPSPLPDLGLSLRSGDTVISPGYYTQSQSPDEHIMISPCSRLQTNSLELQGPYAQYPSRD